MSHTFEFLLRLGDNALVLGQRLSEWCGRAPVLEEDIALANTALDMIGQTQLWLNLAAEVESSGRTADDLAFLREAMDFRNLLLVEHPNQDFAITIMRQFLFDAYHLPYLQALEGSTDSRIADIAAKCVKEAHYHLERSSGLVIALGDGTEESHDRMQAALDKLWSYTGEMFISDQIDQAMLDSGIAPPLDDIKEPWQKTIQSCLDEACLKIPDSDFSHQGGKNGTRHTEHLGHMLSTMQVLQRSYPGAQW
jgi:ring-1,2-phenylacetyl-CoA epoxidase subunit PaaC